MIVLQAKHLNNYWSNKAQSDISPSLSVMSMTLKQVNSYFSLGCKSGMPSASSIEKAKESNASLHQIHCPVSSQSSLGNADPWKPSLTHLHSLFLLLRTPLHWDSLGFEVEQESKRQWAELFSVRSHMPSVNMRFLLGPEASVWGMTNTSEVQPSFVETVYRWEGCPIHGLPVLGI